jgi:ribosomal protein S18 acetylase RimI-like enzyme
MTCKLSPPGPDDYLSIASWITDAAACIRWAGPRVPFPFSATELPRLLAIDGIHRYFLVDESTDTCGFGQFWITTPVAVHLGRIIVSPAKRGQGYGRKLCQQLIQKAVVHTGANEVSLRVYRDNSAALSLYRSLSFVVDDRRSTDEVLFMRAPVPRITLMPDRA